MLKSSQISREKLDWLLAQPLATKLELMGQHLCICKIVINSLLEDEVISYAGNRYCRSKPYDGRYHRWGYNPGSVKLGNQKIKIDVPRVYDRQAHQHIPLHCYGELGQLPEQKEEMLHAILHGLSMRDYGGAVAQLCDSFGLSASSISRAFVERTGQLVEAFEQRQLSTHEFVAVFIDGKCLQGQQMVVALGVTAQGKKIPLGVVQASTENAKSIGELLRELISRGLHYEEGLLFIIDGAKGLRKAIQDVFGHKAVVQRCCWHKRENVVSYLPDKQQDIFRKKLQKAYRQDTYQQAKESLLLIQQELLPLNRSAARSLQEGVEETLTLHRLELHAIFQKSFTTTNCIESLNSQLSKYTAKVKRWMDSDQRYRWVIAGLVQIEDRMHKVAQYKQLYLIKLKLKQETCRNEQKRKAKAA